MKKAVLFISLLAVFTAVGSVYQLKAVPYAVVASVVVVTLLVAFGRIKERQYPIYVFGLALALIWQTSMLGGYIVGADIHSEYYVVMQTIKHGWNLDWVNNGNYSLVLTWLSVYLAKIGFDPIWQFKILFPAICATAPLILYLAFRRVFGEQRAFYASLFFMIMPMYTMEVVSMVKSQWGYPCMAGVVYFMVADVGVKKRITGIVLCSVGAIFSHYTVGIVLTVYLVCILGMLVVTNWGRLRQWFGERMALKWSVLTVALVMVVFVGYFGLVSKGGMLRTVLMVSRGATMLAMTEIGSAEVEVEEKVTVAVPKEQQTNPHPPTETNPVPTIDPSKSFKDYEEIREHAKTITKPVEDRSYLDSQPQLIRAAIGLDFMQVSNWGKVFRVFQYLTQVMILCGLFWLFKRREDYRLTAMYSCGVVVSMVLLVASIFVPYFTVSTLSVTRLYAITLFFIAPLLVVGVERIVALGRK